MGRGGRRRGRLSTLPCTRIQRQYNACLHRRDARPSSSLPVVALMTSMAESPTVQLTLKLGAFPGCRASVLLMPGRGDGRRDTAPRTTGARDQVGARGSVPPPAAQEQCLLGGGRKVPEPEPVHRHSTSDSPGQQSWNAGQAVHRRRAT